MTSSDNCYILNVRFWNTLVDEIEESSMMILNHPQPTSICMVYIMEGFAD